MLIGCKMDNFTSSKAEYWLLKCPFSHPNVMSSGIKYISFFQDNCSELFKCDFHLNCMLYTSGIGVVFMTYLPETAGIFSPWTEVLYRVSDAAKVPCIINNSTKVVQCLRRGRDVYMPFKFVKEYFEVSIVATFWAQVMKW